MENLQITAFMATSIAITDKWSPNLDALLYWLWLNERGLANPNANAKNFIKAEIPIKEVEEKGFSFYAVSSPLYQTKSKFTIRYRKRWDNQDKHLNWGNKKAKVDTSQGQFKNGDLPLLLVETKRIDWFCVGCKDEIERLLSSCTHLGKKRSQGKGQVLRWQIKLIECDHSLYYENKLMRPLPVELINPNQLRGGVTFDLMQWAYKPPYFLPEHKTICAMPNFC